MLPRGRRPQASADALSSFIDDLSSIPVTSCLTRYPHSSEFLCEISKKTFCIEICGKVSRGITKQIEKNNVGSQSQFAHRVEIHRAA